MMNEQRPSKELVPTLEQLHEYAYAIKLWPRNKPVPIQMLDVLRMQVKAAWGLRSAEPPSDAPRPIWSEALQDDIYYASEIDPYINRLRATDEPEAVQSRPCGLCSGLGCRMCGMTGKYIPDAPTGPFACENCNRLAREAHTWSTALAETIKRHRAASPPGARHLLSCSMVKHPNCTRCDCGSSIDIESHSGHQWPGVKSARLPADDRGLVEARSNPSTRSDSKSETADQAGGQQHCPGDAGEAGALDTQRPLTPRHSSSTQPPRVTRPKVELHRGWAFIGDEIYVKADVAGWLDRKSGKFLDIQTRPTMQGDWVALYMGATSTKEAPRELTPTEAASFDKTLQRSPRRVWHIYSPREGTELCGICGFHKSEHAPEHMPTGEKECAHLPNQAAWCPKCTATETSVSPNQKCPRCGFVTVNVFDCPTCKNPGTPYGIET